MVQPRMYPFPFTVWKEAVSQRYAKPLFHTVCRRLTGIAVLGLTVCAYFPRCAVASQSTVEAWNLVQQSEQSKNQGDLLTAITLCRKAIDLDGQNVSYWNVISFYYYQARDFQEGMRSARHAVVLSSGSGDSYAMIAYNQLGLGDIETATETFKHAISRPMSPQLYTGVVEELSRLTVRTIRVTANLAVDRVTLIPVPPAHLPYQESTYKLVGATAVESVQDGSTIATITPTPGVAKATVELTFVVHPYSFERQLVATTESPQDADGPLPADVSSSLDSAAFFDTGSDPVKKVLSELRPANGTVDRVASISEWLKRNIRYQETDDYASVDETLTRRHGQCMHFSQAFAALARAEGIPARVVQVLDETRASKQTHTLDWHDIDEFYLTGVGWVPIDPQEPTTLGFIPTSYIYIDHFQDQIARYGEAELGIKPAYVEVTPTDGNAPAASSVDHGMRPTVN